jgi:hypothetical protein
LEVQHVSALYLLYFGDFVKRTNDEHKIRGFGLAATLRCNGSMKAQFFLKKSFVLLFEDPFTALFSVALHLWSCTRPIFVRFQHELLVRFHNTSLRTTTQLDADVLFCSAKALTYSFSYNDFHSSSTFCRCALAWRPFHGRKYG